MHACTHTLHFFFNLHFNRNALGGKKKKIILKTRVLFKQANIAVLLLCPKTALSEPSETITFTELSI